MPILTQRNTTAHLQRVSQPWVARVVRLPDLTSSQTPNALTPSTAGRLRPPTSAWANALRLALDFILPSNSVVSVTVTAPNAPELALPASDGSPEPNIRNDAPREGDQLDLGLA